MKNLHEAVYVQAQNTNELETRINCLKLSFLVESSLGGDLKKRFVGWISH
jgi:hypothetical protein